MNYLLLGLLQTFLQLFDSQMEGASVFAVSLINKRLMTRKSKSAAKRDTSTQCRLQKTFSGRKLGRAVRSTSSQFLPHSQEERDRVGRRSTTADPQWWRRRKAWGWEWHLKWHKQNNDVTTTTKSLHIMINGAERYTFPSSNACYIFRTRTTINQPFVMSQWTLTPHCSAERQATPLPTAKHKEVPT